MMKSSSSEEALIGVEVMTMCDTCHGVYFEDALVFEASSVLGEPKVCLECDPEAELADYLLTLKHDAESQ